MLTSQRSVLAAEVSAAAWTVDFLSHPLDRTLERLLTWRRSLGHSLTVGAPTAFPDCLNTLDPLEAPWTTELLVDCGNWTAYMNNGLHGGDSTAAAPALHAMLGGQLVSAEHTPFYGPHASTHLWISGPNGKPPLMYERTIHVWCEFGRWAWDDGGEPKPFETVDRYTKRLKRERFDRALLIDYLGAMGIFPDDESFWGNGTTVTQTVTWSTRKMSFDEAARDLELRLRLP